MLKTQNKCNYRALAPSYFISPMVTTRRGAGAGPATAGEASIPSSPVKTPPPRATRAKASPSNGAGFFGTHDKIALYVPNLIGYARIILAFYSFYVAFTSPALSLVAYFLSFVCDELDGRFARLLKQESTFGKVLDMVTDRTATLGLLVILALRYPQYYMAALGLTILDLFSHWAQMYSTLVSGATTHKDVKSKSALIRLYYSSRIFMGYCCVSCEILYLALYALSFPLGQALPLPIGPLAAAINGLGALPVQVPPSISFAALLAIAALPGFAIKQVANVLQLKTAFQGLTEYDLKQRK